MALYEDLKRRDIVPRIYEELNAGRLELRRNAEGIYKLMVGPSLVEGEPESPWIFARGAMDRVCLKWLRIYHMMFKLLPRPCFSCFKVVGKPRTLEELFKVFEVQQEEMLPAKCGIERRDYNKFRGAYAGFWYCPLDPDVNKARDYYKGVAESLKKKISPDFPVILKRGCTEMENWAGPSNTWKRTKETDELEDYLDSIFEIYADEIWQPSWYMDHVKVLWIEYAFENRDPTVRKYVDHYPHSFNQENTTTYHGDVVPDIGCPGKMEEIKDYLRAPTRQGIKYGKATKA